jgi:transposase-like protein
VHGVSTRSVDGLVKALGGTGVSKSHVWMAPGLQGKS